MHHLASLSQPVLFHDIDEFNTKHSIVQCKGEKSYLHLRPIWINIKRYSEFAAYSTSAYEQACINYFYNKNNINLNLYISYKVFSEALLEKL